MIHLPTHWKTVASNCPNAVINFSAAIGVTIGFEENDTMVVEDDQFHEPCLKVLKGELRHKTVVNVSYQDGSATRE